MERVLFFALLKGKQGKNMYEKLENLRKLPEEKKFGYIWRIGNDIENGILPQWRHISETINKELGVPEDEYLSESAYRKMYQSAKKFYDEGVFKTNSSSDELNQIKNAIVENKKTLAKVRTENIEINKLYREMGRSKLLADRVTEAALLMSEKQPFTIPSPLNIIKNNQKTACLCFGDTHYGVEFTVKGLYGEVINAYNPEIFENRMWKLLEKIKEIIVKEKLTTLNVYSLGDELEGILRMSQLMKLRYGIVESTMKYSEFICLWLNELSKYVYIRYQMTTGNHTQLRMLNGKKGTFEDENMSIIIKWYIKERMKNNPNFTLIDNETNMIFDNVCGYNLLGIHGEVKNMESALKDFTQIYDVKINYLIAGHLHHQKEQEVGKNFKVINIGSIIGLDNYSLSLGKSANASATVLIFEENQGKSIEYSINLN